MSTSDDTDALPMILAGLILLIMGTAVAMYPGGPTPAAPRDEGARSDDSQLARPAATPGADDSSAHGMPVDDPRIADANGAMH